MDKKSIPDVKIAMSCKILGWFFQTGFVKSQIEYKKPGWVHVPKQEHQNDFLLKRQNY